ncbi:MAG: hypothetical protein PHE17_21655 [Thiothrix sp.]|uniref:CopG family ribbon-helix-helix protein n=1 Tax=Thiothrix sp. TaxID=1032 RepID=UPI002607D863|nr:hypothetical protein [Thiothrix sp.]MDD5395636.1 hypothetical protein [Thiothrix sp.]
MSNTITLPQSVFKRLEKISATTRCTPEAFAKQAITERIKYEEWALEQIDAGLAELKAGKGIPHDEFLKRIGAVKHAKKAA